MELFAMSSVDQDGYLIPQTILYKIVTGEALAWEDPPAFGDRIMRQLTGSRSGKKHYTMLSQGTMDKLLFDGMNQAVRAGYAAPEYPAIPAWLGENLPYQVVFLPNGEILCYGELGLHFSDSTRSNYWDPRWPPSLQWYRYSIEGELLEEFSQPLHRERNWQAHYYDQAELEDTAFDSGQPESAADSELQTITTARYIDGYEVNHSFSYTNANGGFFSPISSSYQIISVFDWLGNPVPLDKPASAYSSAVLKAISRDTLQTEYDRQVAAGTTDPTAVSPFMRLANGPQIVDPTPRLPPIYATRWTPQGQDQIEIKPSDHPDNPYADDYQVWDHWLQARLGIAMGTLSISSNSDPFKTRQAAIEAAKSMDDQLEAERLAGLPVRFPFDPADMSQSFNLQVNPDGFVMPIFHSLDSVARVPTQDLTWIPKDYFKKYSNTPETSEPTYLISAGGSMETELRNEFLLAKYSELLDTYPQIPSWLVENPVGVATFLRDGSVITYDELGSCLDPIMLPLEYFNQRVVDHMQENSFEYPCFLYSLEGELVRQEMGTRQQDYLVLLFPEYRSFQSKVEAAGHKILHAHPGYLLVTTGPLKRTESGTWDCPEILEAYTVYGEKLSINKPIPLSNGGRIWFPNTLRWNQIRDIYTVQQLLKETAASD